MDKEDFNPRSREGSDNYGSWGNVEFVKFQSSLPRGERQFLNWTCKSSSKISILAPARGATQHLMLQILWIPNFNPRSREGSD